MMNSSLLDKSLDFATQIVLFNEAVYGNSKADFISKLHIAQKKRVKASTG